MDPPRTILDRYRMKMGTVVGGVGQLVPGNQYAFQCGNQLVLHPMGVLNPGFYLGVFQGIMSQQENGHPVYFVIMTNVCRLTIPADTPPPQIRGKEIRCDQTPPRQFVQWRRTFGIDGSVFFFKIEHMLRARQGTDYGMDYDSERWISQFLGGRKRRSRTSKRRRHRSRKTRRYRS